MEIPALPGKAIICILLQSPTGALGRCSPDKRHQGVTLRKGPLRPPRNHTPPRVLGADKGDGVEGVTGSREKRKKEKRETLTGLEKGSRLTAAIRKEARRASGRSLFFFPENFSSV